MPVLTREIIFKGQSAAGGWNRKQVEAIGIAWRELTPGWIDRACGREVPQAAVDRFLELRGQISASTKKDTRNWRGGVCENTSILIRSEKPTCVRSPSCAKWDCCEANPS